MCLCFLLLGSSFTEGLATLQGHDWYALKVLALVWQYSRYLSEARTRTASSSPEIPDPN